jgi:hypothetical protein
VKLTAKEVQQMLGVADFDEVAHGYTFDRDTVDIYFADGKMIREVWGIGWGVSETRKDYRESDYFEIDYLKDGIKRWYLNKTNPKLVQLYETFNGPFNGV